MLKDSALAVSEDELKFLESHLPKNVWDDCFVNGRRLVTLKGIYLLGLIYLGRLFGRTLAETIQPLIDLDNALREEFSEHDWQTLTQSLSTTSLSRSQDGLLMRLGDGDGREKLQAPQDQSAQLS